LNTRVVHCDVLLVRFDSASGVETVDVLTIVSGPA
jgi:hypothetical protein